jgi:phosphoglycerate kinase
MIITGGMVFTFLKASEGESIRNSLFDDEGAAIAPELLEATKSKSVRIHLIDDFVCEDRFEPDCDVRAVAMAEGIPDGSGFDIGPQTIVNYVKAIQRAKTIIWNGPVERYEWNALKAGTWGILDACAFTAQGTFVVIGGGACADNWG